jgi:hypothetical protein
MINAATYVPGVLNGDGDGLLGTIMGGGPAPVSVGLATNQITGFNANEMYYFWYTLATLGLIQVPNVPNAILSCQPMCCANNAGAYPCCFPAIAMNKSTGILAYGNNKDGINYYHLGVNVLCFGVTTSDALSPSDAFYIDTKIDDGIANMGTIAAREGVEGAPTLTGTSTPSSAGGCVILLSGTFSASVNVPLQYNIGTNAVACQLRIKMGS